MRGFKGFDQRLNAQGLGVWGLYGFTGVKGLGIQEYS